MQPNRRQASSYRYCTELRQAGPYRYCTELRQASPYRYCTELRQASPYRYCTELRPASSYRYCTELRQARNPVGAGLPAMNTPPFHLRNLYFFALPKMPSFLARTEVHAQLLGIFVPYKKPCFTYKTRSKSEQTHKLLIINTNIVYLRKYPNWHCSCTKRRITYKTDQRTFPWL